MDYSIKQFVKSNYVKLKTKGSFAQNFAITFSGNAISLAIGFAFTPFIARIYTPEAYGVFALFTAFSQNIGTIATLQFTRAFVLPKKDEVFIELVKITILSSIFFSILSLIIFLVFGEELLKLFSAQSMGDWLLVVPIMVFLSSLNDIFSSWNIRVKEFNKSAFGKVSTVISTRSVTVTYGLLISGNSLGLIIGDLLSKPINICFLAGKKIRKNLGLILQNYDFRYLKEVWNRYNSYPYFILPSSWINNFSNQIPIYFLIFFFDSTVVGYYSFSNSLLNIPAIVLSSALAPVFLQKATETYHSSPKDIPVLVKKLYKRLFYAGLIPFSVLIVFGDIIFKIVLGEQWEMSGYFARYMGFYFIFWIVSSSFNSLFRIYEKERLNLIINILTLVLKLVGLSVGIFYNNYLLSILFFSVGFAIGNLIQIIVLFKLAKLHFIQTFLISIFSLVIVIGFMYSLRLII